PTLRRGHGTTWPPDLLLPQNVADRDSYSLHRSARNSWLSCVRSASASTVLDYPFPVHENGIAYLRLPTDLKTAEVARLWRRISPLPHEPATHRLRINLRPQSTDAGNSSADAM